MIEYTDYLAPAHYMVQEAAVQFVKIYYSIRKLYRNEKTYKFFEYGAMCVVRV